MRITRPRSRILTALAASCALLLALPLPAANEAGQQPHASKIGTIFVMPSSHWDLGFLAPPEEILPRLKPHIDEVIANCKADPDFRWTIESTWQVREWLARTDEPQLVADFVSLVRNGQIQLSAVFGSMHTEFMGAETLNRITYDAKELEQRLGIKTDFAMMNDVPGFTLRLPQILSRSGIKYFVNGSNLFIGGGSALSPGRVPFYWQAPDGSRVLTWHTQSRFGGYTEALADYWLDPQAVEPYTREHFYPKELEGLPPLEIMQRGVDKLLAKLEEAGYAYDAVLVMYMHDFMSSNQARESLLPSVRAWNGAGRQPRIVVATPAEFFRHMEGKYGDRFGAFAGDWSGLWSEVKTNSPRVSAHARWIHDHLPVAEMLWTMLTFRPETSFPAGNFEEARIKILKYDEHSGAGQVGWPKLMSRFEVDQQNRQYVQYTSEARAEIAHLIKTGMGTLFSQVSVPDGRRRLVVFNPLSWPRTDTVRLKTTPGEDQVQVFDAVTGEAVPLQRTPNGEVEFIAHAIPGVGYRTYLLADSADLPEPQPARPLTGESTLENEFYRLRISSDGTISSILDKQFRAELVDPQRGRFNQPLRWTFSSEFPAAVGQPRLEHEAGPVALRTIVYRPGTWWPETRITLYRGLKRVEISNLLDRTRMPYVASLQPGELYSFTFPFRFEDSANVWVENGSGFHRVPQDYLPGARTDSAVPQHSLVLAGRSEGKPLNVVLAQRQAFFDYLPALPDAAGSARFLNTVRAGAMRKQDQGETRDLGMVNFRTVEPGLDEVPLWYDFHLASSPGAFDAVHAYRAGWDLTLPLLGTELPVGVAPANPVGSFFSVSARNVVLLAFKPSADGDPQHYTVRLQEIAGERADFEVTTSLRVWGAEKTSMTESTVIRQADLKALSIGPHQTLTLRLTIPREVKTRSHRWWEW